MRNLPGLAAILTGAVLILVVLSGYDGRACSSEVGEKTESKEARSELVWHESLEDALAEARKRETPVVAVFHAEWCGWCGKMERETLSDEGVAERLGGFALLRLDVDEQGELTELYGVSGLPTTMALTSAGEVLAWRPGYMSPETFMLFLDHVDERAGAPEE